MRFTCLLNGIRLTVNMNCRAKNGISMTLTKTGSISLTMPPGSTREDAMAFIKKHKVWILNRVMTGIGQASAEERSIETPAGTFSYTLVRKAVRNMTVRLDDGRVRVTASPNAPIEDIEAFLTDKAEWILKRYAPNRRSTDEGETLLYLGERYRLIQREGSRASLTIRNGEAVLTYPKGTQPREALDRALKTRAAQMFPELVREVLPLFFAWSLPEPRFTIRKMRSQWGSMNHGKGTGSLNLLLMHAPVDCIRFVIAHELTHLIVPNHSADFYRVLAGVMPDHAKRKAELESLHIMRDAFPED